MPWNGNKSAQSQADAAWNAVKFKFNKKKAKTSKRKSASKQQTKGKKPAKVDYHEYMKSAAWQRKRRKMFSKFGEFCQICRSSNDLQIHHKTYKNLGREPLEDLQILCKACHENHHEGNVFGVADPLTREFRNQFR